MYISLCGFGAPREAFLSTVYVETPQGSTEAFASFQQLLVPSPSKAEAQFWEQTALRKLALLVYLACGIVTRGLACIIYWSMECWSRLPKQVLLSLGLLRQSPTWVCAHLLPNHTHVSFTSASQVQAHLWLWWAPSGKHRVTTSVPPTGQRKTHHPSEQHRPLAPWTFPNFDSLLFFWTSISDIFHVGI